MQSLDKDAYRIIFKYIYDDCLKYMLIRLTITTCYLDLTNRKRLEYYDNNWRIKMCKTCRKWLVYENNRVTFSHWCE